MDELARRRGLEAAAADGSAFTMDEDAFRGFYERNARSLWAYLARTTGSREMADDLLQETFYRFLRAAATHEGESHRRNSLYRIATNLVRDARRRSVVRGILSLAGDAVEQLPAPPYNEQSSDVTRALANLKLRERAILWLAYAEGASHREIAEVMGVKPASLKPMLVRARQKLAALLGGGPGKRETR